jgi:hypothetical protein
MPKTEYLIYLIIIAVSFLLGLIFSYKKKQLKWVVILLGITLLSEILTRIFAYKIKNSNPVYHFFTPIQIMLWNMFFLSVLKSKKIKRIISPLSAALIFFSIINSVLLEGLRTFPENILRLESVFLIFCGVCLFIEKLDEPSEQNLFKSPVFIISIAVLWFNLISFIFFESYNFFLRNKIPSQSIRTIHYISNYVYYLIILVAIILSKQFYTVERK